jgi:hypothetical protein
MTPARSSRALVLVFFSAESLTMVCRRLCHAGDFWYGARLGRASQTGWAAGFVTLAAGVDFGRWAIGWVKPVFPSS